MNEQPRARHTIGSVRNTEVECLADRRVFFLGGTGHAGSKPAEADEKAARKAKKRERQARKRGRK